jgi:hypothetical protein
VVEKFSVREEREDENNQEEVVKSQSALHVAHFGSTLAKIFWLETLTSNLLLLFCFSLKYTL